MKPLEKYFELRIKLGTYGVKKSEKVVSLIRVSLLESGFLNGNLESQRVLNLRSSDNSLSRIVMGKVNNCFEIVQQNKNQKEFYRILLKEIFYSKLDSQRRFDELLKNGFSLEQEDRKVRASYSKSNSIVFLDDVSGKGRNNISYLILKMDENNLIKQAQEFFDFFSNLDNGVGKKIENFLNYLVG